MTVTFQTLTNSNILPGYGHSYSQLFHSVLVSGYWIFQTVASIMLFSYSSPFHSAILFLLSALPVWPTSWSPIERIYNFYFLSRYFVSFRVSDVWIRCILLAVGVPFFLLKYCTVWRGSSVGIVTTLWNGYFSVRGSLLDSQKGVLCLVHHIHTCSWAQKAPIEIKSGEFTVPW